MSPWIGRSLGANETGVSGTHLAAPIPALTVGGLYWFLGWIGQSLALPPDGIALFWPPSGFALAAVLVLGSGVWPGILLGALVLQAGAGFDESSARGLLIPILVALVGAGGAVGQALLGAWMVRRAERNGAFSLALTEPLAIATLALLGGVVACLPVAALHAGAHWLSGNFSTTLGGDFFLETWLGNGLGVILFAPVTLVWLQPAGIPLLRAATVTVAVLLCSGLAVVLTVNLARNELTVINRSFATGSYTLASDLDRAVQAQLDTVASLEALLSYDVPVQQSRFRRVAARVRARQGTLDSLQWVPRVPPENREAFEAQMQGLGHKGYRIHRHPEAPLKSQTEGGPVSGSASGPGGLDLFPVAISDPPERLQDSLGLDLGSQPEVRAAFERSAQAGGPGLSEPLALIRGSAASVYAVTPVFSHPAEIQRETEARREALVGFVVGAVRLEPLVEMALSWADRSEILYWLRDETDHRHPRMLYANALTPLAPQETGGTGLFWLRARFDLAIPMQIGTRIWVLHTAPGPDYLTRHISGNAMLLLLTGLLFAGGAGAFALLVTGREQSLLAMVAERTQALSISEARYRALFSRAKVAMLLVDPSDGRIVDGNDAAFEYYGYTRDQLRELRITSINMLTKEEVAAEMMLARQECRSHFYFRHRLASGSIRDVEVHSGPVMSDEKVLLFSIIHDITERRQAEQALMVSEERYRQVFANSPLPMWVYAPGDLTFLDVNQAALNHYGYDREEFLALTLKDIRPPGEVPKLIEVVSNETLQGRSGEYIHCKKDGTQIAVMVWSKPLESSPNSARIALLQDITERKLAERQIMEANHLLEHQSQKLRSINQELEQFAYVASHDLRQPLRMVNSYLSLISKRLGPSLDEDVKSYMDFAVNGGRRMDALIRDLLEYSRTGRRDVAFVPVSLETVLSDSLINLEVALLEAGAQVSVAEGLPCIAGDAAQLVRLFQNLVGNAIKYRAPDRTPMVTITSRQDGADWIVCIADNGIGIDPKDHDRAFGIFQRLVGSTEYEGNGIGLAVCRKIMDHHGGRIWIESELGVGCRFFLAFPPIGAGLKLIA